MNTAATATVTPIGTVTRRAPASEVKVGDYIRFYGPNSLGHLVSAVRLEPRAHRENGVEVTKVYVVIETDNGRSVSYTLPHLPEWITDGL